MPGDVGHHDLGLGVADAHELGGEVARALGDEELARLLRAHLLHALARGGGGVLAPHVVVGEEEPPGAQVLDHERPERVGEHPVVGVPDEVHALALLAAHGVRAGVAVEVDDAVALGQLGQGRGHPAAERADHEVDLVALDQALGLAHRHRGVRLRVLPPVLDRAPQHAALGVLLLDGEDHAAAVGLAAVREGAGGVAGEADRGWASCPGRPPGARAR